MKVAGSMNSVLRLIVTLIMICALAASAKREKPLVIATTDGELDDRSSMVRFLIPFRLDSSCQRCPIEPFPYRFRNP